MIYRNSLILMQRIQQSVINEHFYYVTGEVDETRYSELERKFDFSYDTRLSRQSKYRRRKSGEAVAKLHAVNTHGKIWFVLMATAGAGRVHVRENLRDVRDSENRLTSAKAAYELVHDGVGWSWRMTKARYNWYRERIHLTAALPPNRRRIIEINDIICDFHAEKIQDTLYSEPGFRLTRRQVGTLKVYMREQWKRLRPGSGPQPLKRTFLPYVRFMANEEKDRLAKQYQNLKWPMPDSAASDWLERLGNE